MLTTRIIIKSKIALRLLLVMSVLTGLIYPLIVTLFAQLLFPWEADGSLITENGVVIGSALIGQSFDEPRYIWGRPSATTPYPYNATLSNGANLGPDNPDLLKRVTQQAAAIRNAHPGEHGQVPLELVTTSASGLDPHISPIAALYQSGRVAKARKLPETEVRQIILQSIEPRTLGFLGEPRINVLRLNVALDRLSNSARTF